MIFGDCPHCDKPFATSVPDWDGSVKAEKLTCEDCGNWFWVVHSRVDPKTYLPEEIVVNEKARSIKIVKLEVC